MKIIVCVKVIKGEINPFDESALECALTLSNDVTVLSMGPKSCEDALKPLTRLGAKVVLISDGVFAGSDTLATSYILSTAIKNMEYDLILCGRQSIDGDTAQVGPMLSQMLGCLLVTNALSVEVNENEVFTKTRMGDETVKTPALITLERGYVLRFPSIFSKVGEVKIIDNSTLNCDLEKCGLSGSPTKVLQSFENERGKRKCKFITMAELFPLVEKLKNENVKRILAEAVKLETPYKEVFYMKTLGDMPYSTIADVFEKTENWARVTYFRAKKQIEERMSEGE